LGGLGLDASSFLKALVLEDKAAGKPIGADRNESWMGSRGRKSASFILSTAIWG
jgi:hypothetical protein